MSMRAVAGLYIPERTWSAPALESQVSHMLAGITSQHMDRTVAHERLFMAAAPFAGRKAFVTGERPAQQALLIGDVRLDNGAALARELGLPASSTDEAIVAAGWRRWSYDLPHHLEGGFALACWDEPERTLFLVRDHAGERPLHVLSGLDRDGCFGFASMPLQLCRMATLGHRVHLERIAELLSAVDLESPKTCFEGIERLPPSHWVKISPSGMETRAYWYPLQSRPIRYARDSDYIEDLRERFDRATGVLLADSGGVGCELSGGLDSTSVMATAATLLAREGRRLTAFTAVPMPGFNGNALPGRFADEGPTAMASAAQHANVTHVLVDAANRDLLETSDRLARLTGQPATSPVNELWLTAILDGMQARGLDVLLVGYAGNYTISFGGLIGLNNLFRRLRWIELFRRTRELRARGYTSWRGAAGWATGGVVPAWLRARYHPDLRHFRMDASPVRPERIAEQRLRERALDSIFGEESSLAEMRRRLYEVFDVGVPNGSAAAGWGIAQRDPTQARSILEFCYGIPIEQFLAGGQTRSLVRRAMEGRLPEAVLRQTMRGMQSADWYLVVGAQRERLAAELRRVGHSPQVQNLLDMPRLQRLIETWPTSGYNDPQTYESYNLALTRGIAAASFVASWDPDMPREIDSPLETTRPGTGPGLAETHRV